MLDTLKRMAAFSIDQTEFVLEQGMALFDKSLRYLIPDFFDDPDWVRMMKYNLECFRGVLSARWHLFFILSDHCLDLLFRFVLRVQISGKG